MHTNVMNFLSLLRELQKIHPEFPIQYAICLAEISLCEGMSLTVLSKKTGMPLSTVSRIIRALSRKKGASGYGLVKVTISTEERRKKALYLSPRGNIVMRSIVDILSEKTTERLPARL